MYPINHEAMSVDVRFNDESDDVADVQKAISAGQDVNVKNKAGDTPLLAAIRRGSLEMVKTLLSLGADANARDKNGETPLKDTCLQC